MTIQSERSVLSPLDILILQNLADGVTMEQTAKDVRLSYNTLKNHTKAIRETMGADTTIQAVTMALRRGLIE
jgi:DNA-binding NarL/FixJ family response regulator